MYCTSIPQGVGDRPSRDGSEGFTPRGGSPPSEYLGQPYL